MVQDQLTGVLSAAAVAAAAELGLDPAELPEPELQRPRQKEHGDWATNLALVLAPRIGRPPRDVAEAIARHVETGGHVDKVEVAGPGFINLHLGPGWLHDLLREVLDRGEVFGRRAESRGLRANVEFVSANPTGPLHVGHARNAVLGDAIASVLTADGYDVDREYYWNDTGTQMDLLGGSVEARYLQRFGRETPIPEGGYQGEYVAELAAAIAADHGERWMQVDQAERRAFFIEESRTRMVDWIRRTLDRVGIRFDVWFSEATLQERGEIDEAVALLREAGHAYDADGAVWFRSTSFGDDKDRVLIRSNGEATYFGKDVAYLRDKFGRGYDRLVYVWGADHHGDVKRMLGVAEALGFDTAATDFVLYQFVSFSRGGEPAKMSKRAGEFVTFDELLDEVGPDAARYTLLTRSSDSAIDFDIEEVKRQSMENPVYYVQYAHARIASLVRMAQARGLALEPWPEVDLARLTHESELDLLRKLAELPETVEAAAAGRAPHRLTRYAEDTAAAFHRFYTDCRIIGDDPALTQARLWLSVGTRQVIGAALGLLGVSAPESMERLGDTDDEPDGERPDGG
ncbi:MAG TPA: arginine--tRNA ligase [Actinomycetota bacterium]|nr:arginine--tRNA ligase [Actinomycetota bacterium]